MTAAKTIKTVSVEEYLAGELTSRVKHEFLGGYIHAMAGGTNAHNDIVVSFTIAIGAALRSKPCLPCNSDTKVRIELRTQTRFYYPDAMVVCEPNDANESFQERPVLIAEVMSDSTRKIDEREKRDAYLEIPTLSIYLMIESKLPRVIVHRRTASGFVAEQYDGLNAVIPLEVIDAKLSLAELYERVDFKVAQQGDDDLED